jgi:hypothetical protein
MKKIGARDTMRIARTLLLLGVIGAIAASAAYAAEPKTRSSAGAARTANIYVVASKSFCLASGISDVYTGDGKVIFYVTLRNSGTSDGKVNIVPVRHYDDGEINESAMDMLLDVQVPAHAVRRYRSPAYKYKAHEHEVEACGLKINNRREVMIPAVH